MMSSQLVRQFCSFTLVMGLSIQSMAMGTVCLCSEALSHSSCCSSVEEGCCCSEAGGCCCCSDEEGLSESLSECNCGQPEPQPLAPAAPDTRQVVELLLSFAVHSGLPEEVVPAVTLPGTQLESSTQNTLTEPQILLCVWQT